MDCSKVEEVSNALESVSLPNNEEKSDPSKPSRTSKAQKKRVSYFNHIRLLYVRLFWKHWKFLSVFLGQKGCSWEGAGGPDCWSGSGESRRLPSSGGAEAETEADGEAPADQRDLFWRSLHVPRCGGSADGEKHHPQSQRASGSNSSVHEEPCRRLPPVPHWPQFRRHVHCRWMPDSVPYTSIDR